MAKARDPKKLQVLKAPSGDMMLVVPLDKRSLAKLRGKNMSVAVLVDEPKIHLPICGVRYDKFMLTKDLVIHPGGRNVRKVAKKRVGTRK
jgi:hypothetical protein